MEQTVFDQLVAHAIKLGLPKYFTRDLSEHDKNLLEDNRGKPFAWLLYDCGTHMCFTVQYTQDVADCFGTKHGEWFFCNGETVSKVGYAAAFALMVAEQGRKNDARTHHEGRE